jgi:gamma-glutamyltranspeptidase/glutathione hydrolase
MGTKTRGAIAAGNPKTAEAGIEMFRLGGNVFDAAIAAVLAACVAEPCLTSLAGGGFLLAHTHDHQNILFDFFTQTPRQRKTTQDVNFYPVEVNFGTAIQEFHIGLGSIAVPGAIAGLFHVHQKLGRLPFKVLFEPAIHYAKTGVEIDPFQAYCFKILSPILLASQEMASVIAPQKSLLQPGETMTMSGFADTLAYFAEQGPQPLYTGELAHQLVNDCQAQGGYLTLEDLQNYRVIEREPLTTCYRGNTFLTNPPPSSGGALIAFSLALLSHLDLAQISFGSDQHLQLLAQVMHLTNQARKDGYDAQLYEPDISPRFLATEHIHRYTPQLLSNSHPVNKWGSTTHISAIDEEGNAASVTTSNGEGSSYVIPGTGIMLNNMLGEADLHPNGFHQWQTNVRISSMMSPTMVLKHHQPEIVLGSGGSNRIRTAILQVISNIIDFQMSASDAVNSPRVHWENGTFNLEPGLDALTVDRSAFPFDGEVMFWDAQNMFFGGVHTVMQDESGQMTAVGDRRRFGAIAYS